MGQRDVDTPVQYKVPSSTPVPIPPCIGLWSNLPLGLKIREIDITGIDIMNTFLSRDFQEFHLLRISLSFMMAATTDGQKTLEYIGFAAQSPHNNCWSEGSGNNAALCPLDGAKPAPISPWSGVSNPPPSKCCPS